MKTINNNRIVRVEFIEDFRSFKKGQAINFDAGVTGLVGDNGSGKSTMLDVIKANGKIKGKTVAFIHTLSDAPVKSYWFDTEKDNPRNMKPFMQSDNIGARVQAMYLSHGQAMRQYVIAPLKRHLKSDEQVTLLLDEPESGASLKAQVELGELIKAFHIDSISQLIVATHCPSIIKSIRVYDCDIHKAIHGEEYLKRVMK